MRIQSGSGLLAGVGGRGTVNLGKLQVFRVLNFIRFECVIVKVKSGEMTALSKSNVEKIRTVRETREKQALGTNPPKTCRQAGDFYVPSRLPSEKQISSLSFYLENGILFCPTDFFLYVFITEVEILF